MAGAEDGGDLKFAQPDQSNIVPEARDTHDPAAWVGQILLSKELAGACTACVIDKVPRKWERPSDHTPLVATIGLD